MKGAKHHKVHVKFHFFGMMRSVTSTKCVLKVVFINLHNSRLHALESALRSVSTPTALGAQRVKCA